MHYEAMYALGKFAKKYFDLNKPMKILDVGSMDLARPEKKLTYGRFLKRPNWDYTGLDLTKGRNVDVVATGLYEYPFPDNSFDLVVTGNTLEHVLDIHKFIKEVARVSRDWVYVSVPNTHPEHRHPVDCWRVFPDGMRFLLEEIAGLEIIDIYKTSREIKKDTVGIARKKKI